MKSCIWNEFQIKQSKKSIEEDMFLKRYAGRKEIALNNSVFADEPKWFTNHEGKKTISRCLRQN